MFDRTTFAQIGLPADHRVLGMDYHPLTGTVVVHVGPFDDKDRPPGGHLFFRRGADVRYQPVLALPTGTTVDGFVLDQERPSLYFLTSVWEEMDSGGLGGDWDAVYRFDL